MENNVKEHKKCRILPMMEDRKLLLKDVNDFFICKICRGYLIDATGLLECTHTFCRSCIVQRLQKKQKCPICEVQVNKTPLLSLRPDTIMQRLVYKIVPGLYKSELLRRKKLLNETNDMVVSDDESGSQEYYFDPEEPISISLEYVECVGIARNKSDKTNDLIEFQDKTFTKKLEQQTTYKRYLQCPAALKIRHIYKFIKLKYNLKKTHEVEILYENTKLPSYFSLMDTAYTFSWKREKPMRLCYQIFERTVIQVPLVVDNKISDAYTPPKNNFVTDSSSSSSSLNSSSESSKIEEEQPLTSTLGLPSKNLKRKCDSLSETIELCGSAHKDFMRGLELKIPRISVDVLPARTNEPKCELKASDSCANLCSESSLKAPIKTPSNDSGTYSDDYVKYEEDIEEVDDDDDDDEDRLRISQLSDEEMPLDEKAEASPIEQELVIDTSTGDKDEIDEVTEQEDKKAAKYRRKNKKSKHHHHRRHHHRHHERKKLAPQATILHSPDTDIMKLKVKLNTVVPTADSKHHKQSRRKRKRSPEAYFSSSSPSSRASSVAASSPDHGNSISRADEDSLHSHISEVSTESVDTTTSSKEDLPKVSAVVPLPTAAPIQPSPIATKIPDESLKEQPSPGTKEKLLQMRAFRPKSIAVVKPEESDKKVVPVDSAKIIAASKNDDNNNKPDKVPTQIADKLTSTPILRPATSSSITVSKITAAEKILMEKEKRMNVAHEERPSLEITLVSEPSRSSGASSPSTTYPESVSTTTAKVKPNVPRIMKPVPALVHFQAAKSSAKSVSIFPCGKHLQQQRSVKSSSNTDIGKKTNDTLPIIKKDGIKQSVTISLSGKHFSNDPIPSALDLSGKQCAGKLIDKNTMSKNAVAMAAAQANLMQQHAKKAYVQPYGAASLQPQLTPTSLPYNPVTSIASLADSRRLAQTLATKEAAAQFQFMFGSGGGLPFPVMQSPKHSPHTNHRMYTSSPRASPPAQVITLPMAAANNSLKMSKVSGLPALNEIKIGPVSSTAEVAPPRKPGPNQNIRNIPDPSRLLRRQQSGSSAGPITVGVVNGAANKCSSNGGVPIINNRLAPTPCSFTNLKKNGEKCLQMVPKAYLDHSNIMATK